MGSELGHVSPLKDEGKDKTEQSDVVRDFVIRSAEYEREGLAAEGEQLGGRVDVDSSLGKGGDGSLTFLGFACDKYDY